MVIGGTIYSRDCRGDLALAFICVSMIYTFYNDKNIPWSCMFNLLSDLTHHFSQTYGDEGGRLLPDKNGELFAAGSLDPTEVNKVGFKNLLSSLCDF